MYGAGAASFCLEPEPIQVGRSRSRLRDLGHLDPEPEPPKKVAAPQHWFVQVLNFHHKFHGEELRSGQMLRPDPDPATFFLNYSRYGSARLPPDWEKGDTDISIFHSVPVSILTVMEKVSAGKIICKKKRRRMYLNKFFGVFT